MSKTYKEKRQEALEKARVALNKNIEAAKQASNHYKDFEALRKETNALSQDKIPWIREYYKLYIKQEKNPNLFIGAMAKEKDKILVKQGLLNTAASLCEDPDVKAKLLKESEALNNHKAIKNYEKYNKGLQYILGKGEVLEEDVKSFFKDEIASRIADDKNFLKDRGQSFKEVAKTEDSLEVQLMEEVAVVKARQTYSKEGTGFQDALMDQFIGDWPLEQRPSQTEYRDRMSPGVTCMVYMLEKGFKAEDILDPHKLQKEKKQVGQIYRKNRENNNLKWLANRMTKGSEALMNATIKYMEDHKDELKNAEDIALNGNRLGLLIHYCYDMSQEIQVAIGGENKKDFAEKTGKSRDYMNHLIDRLNKYGSLNNWISSTVPENTQYLEKRKMSILMSSQIQLNHLLEMIANGEPNKESQFLDFIQIDDLQKQLSEIPEIKGMTVDAECTKETVKMGGNILNGKFLKEKQLDYVLPGYTVSSKEDILDENEMPTFSEGQKVSAVLMSGDKQIIATDLPVKNKMGQFLGGLESKRDNFRGNNKDNSKEFNELLKTFDEVVSNMKQKDITDEKRLENLAKIKQIAGAYILAKREQKGYTSKKIPDREVDKQMLGVVKGGKSIFTTRGKDRYAFAERLIGNAMKLEKAIEEAQITKKQQEAQKTKIQEIQNKEAQNKKVKENAVTKLQPKETKKLQIEENVLEDDLSL